MLPKIDCHVHSYYSSDSNSNPELIILTAIENGIKHLCFTDHLDFDKDGNCSLNHDACFNEISELKQKYKGYISVQVGIEVDYNEIYEDKASKILSLHDYDYVINSTHFVNFVNVYHPEYFYDKSREQAYGDYLRVVHKSVHAKYHYDAIGHFGYVFRTSPYLPKLLIDGEFSDLIDEILSTVISKNAILEINSKIKGRKQQINIVNSPCLPSPDILTRYYNLGGRKITFGSDAHNVEHVCKGYLPITVLAKEIGFSGYTVINDKKESIIKF